MKKRFLVVASILVLVSMGTVAGFILIDAGSPTYDDFESGNLDGYGPAGAGDTAEEGGSFNITSDSYEGNYGLNATVYGESGDLVIVNNSTGIIAPDPGDTFGYRIKLKDPDVKRNGLVFGAQDNDDYYNVYITGSGSLQLNRVAHDRLGNNKLDMDTATVQNFTTNKWYFVYVEWYGNGTINAYAYNNNNVSVASVSANDTTFTDGGYGWRVSSGYNSDGGSAVYDMAANYSTEVVHNYSLYKWPDQNLVDGGDNDPTLIYDSSRDKPYAILAGDKGGDHDPDLWESQSGSADNWTETQANAYTNVHLMGEVTIVNGTYYGLTLNGWVYKGDDIANMTNQSHNISPDLGSDTDSEESTLLYDNGKWWLATDSATKWGGSCCSSTKVYLYSSPTISGNWTKEGTLVNRTGDSWGTGDPNLIEHNGTYHLFVDNTSSHPNYRINLYTSDELVGGESNWNPHGQVTYDYGGDAEVVRGKDKWVMATEYPNGTTNNGWAIRKFSASTLTDVDVGDVDVGVECDFGNSSKVAQSHITNRSIEIPSTSFRFCDGKSDFSDLQVNTTQNTESETTIYVTRNASANATQFWVNTSYLKSIENTSQMNVEVNGTSVYNQTVVENGTTYVTFSIDSFSTKNVTFTQQSTDQQSPNGNLAGGGGSGGFFSDIGRIPLLLAIVVVVVLIGGIGYMTFKEEDTSWRI